MTKASSTNLEMTLILPLGVVAHQLMKIEADLRLLNMKVVDLINEQGGGHHTRMIQVRLENINDALDSIRGLVSDIEADIHPWSADGILGSDKDHHSHVGSHLALEDDSLPSPDKVHSKYSHRKSHPDRDD